MLVLVILTYFFVANEPFSYILKVLITIRGSKKLSLVI